MTLYAEDKPLQPYIDRLKKGLDSKANVSGSYTEELRKKLDQKDNGLGYSERLRQGLPENKKNQKLNEGYSDQVKAGLEEKKQGGAIEAVEQGKSELHAKFKGDIHHAFGFKFAPSPVRNNVNSGSSATNNNFSAIYGNSWSPDISVFYEFQPFHSEWFGNVGVVFNLSFGYSSGFGAFLRSIQNATESQPPSTYSGTSTIPFQFFTIPFTVGLNYRFNLLRILRPYVFAGPTLIGYAENRTDSQSMNRGNSRGATLSGGVALLMDWMSPSSRWDLYADQGIKHTYLTLDYTKLVTFSGDVNFDNSALSMGFTFEY